MADASVSLSENAPKAPSGSCLKEDGTPGSSLIPDSQTLTLPLACGNLSSGHRELDLDHEILLLVQEGQLRSPKVCGQAEAVLKSWILLPGMAAQNAIYLL